MSERSLIRILYFVLSFTWGAMLSIPGALIFLILCAANCPVRKNGFGWAVVVGKGSSGFSMGPFSILNREYDEYLLNHEFGHSIQNCIFGPLMLPVIVIPSVIRYWYRVYRFNHGTRYNELRGYYDIWFEKTASSFGTRIKERYWLIDDD